ncbi:MAG: hypothetical protein WC238_05915 [Parcubacteria group bacterium]|jgi:uncharacterized membrane protein
MSELKIVLIITLILLTIGSGVYYLQLNYSEFNFYQSELTINQENITEKLNYYTNKPYHTLYRDFQSPIKEPWSTDLNTIEIENVQCQQGTAYFKTFSNNCYVSNSITPSSCLPYTERNEYGCSFGNDYGFSKGKNYWIESNYQLHPKDIIKINNNYYIKFIAYNENNHKRLVAGKNLIVNGEAITAKSYSPDEMVIVYIPYNGNTSKFSIITQNDFEFDNKSLKHFLMLLLCLLPGIIFFSIWFFFGRENFSENVPKELSTYPIKRKAWEVAAFFNPPFGNQNPNLISALLTDFYHRKIIDIQIEKRSFKKNLYVKIKSSEEKALDDIEKDFMHILKFFESHSEKNEGYFKLDFNGLNYLDKQTLRVNYTTFSFDIGIEKRKYFSNPGALSLSLALIVLIAITVLSFGYNSIISFFIFFSFIIASTIASITLLISKYKGNYYPEYQKWQAFKNFLSNSDSMKLHGHKGTIIWGEFLLYATALGVAKKVLEEMKAQKIITESQYNNYSVISSSASLSAYTGGFGSSSSGSSSGGGFSGAGGGGVGGGGGGGR